MGHTLKTTLMMLRRLQKVRSEERRVDWWVKDHQNGRCRFVRQKQK